MVVNYNGSVKSYVKFIQFKDASIETVIRLASETQSLTVTCIELVKLIL